MKPEIRDEWADALDSGEYKQGTKRLTTVLDDGTEEDCCLGVLCKLAVKAGVIPEPVITYDIAVKQKAYGMNGAVGLMPDEVMEWAGVDPAGYGNTVTLDYDNRATNADYLNDSKGLTFKEIAKLVREQL